MAEVLLGIPDQVVAENATTNWMTNKIGARPNWLNSSVPTQLCKICCQPLSFVGQLYCPLSGSDYHRSLYIFVCHRRTCLNLPQSWMVVRAQTKVISEAIQSTCSATDDWGIAADDWGSGADDWGSEADEWGTSDTSEPVETVFSPSTDTVSATDNESIDVSAHATSKTVDAKPQTSAEDGGVCCGGVEHFIPATSDVHQSAETALPTEKYTITDRLQAITFQDSDLAEDSATEYLDAVIPEAVQSFQSQVNVVPLLAENGVDLSENDEPCCEFESFYINVINEPEEEINLDHERRLLDKYIEQEGVDIDGLCSGASTGASGGEKYEKGSLRHGDQTFFKFCKRIGRCPQQIIRYSHCGRPLVARADSRNVVVPRCDCGSNRVFELQLMPALLQYLHRQRDTEPVVEFESVQVYTCRRSCWTDDTDVLHEEFVVIERDNDERFIDTALSQMSALKHQAAGAAETTLPNV